MKKTYFIGVLVFSFPTKANEINILMGGWSKHFEDQEAHLPQYNESHNGFGLEYHQEYHPNRYWLFGVNYLKDSYRKHAFGLAGGWQYRWQWKSLFFNSGWFLGLQHRSITKTYHYPDQKMKLHHIENDWTPLGGLRFGIGYKNLSSAINLLPTFKITNKKWQLKNPVLYWQFALHLPASQTVNAVKALPKRLFSPRDLDENRMTALSQRLTMKPHDY